MCGVIGLIHEQQRQDLGLIAADLLRMLEYRGYDSTGAAIQGLHSTDVDLRKGVGAPSKLVGQLGIDKLAGHMLCAQVRWATFGAVDETNAQPHVVRCKTYIYGAHNGNVTNCDALKVSLTEAGHQVRSDNDGEMVVHAVEHAFAAALAELSAAEAQDPLVRRRVMRGAIVAAGKTLRGSYATVIADPVSHTLWAIKKGSSLYFGVGEADGSKFAVASSDLSAVLKITRVLVPMSEGDFVEMEPTRFQLHKMADGAPFDRAPVRSRLRAQDTALQAPFTTFMEQEIHAQIETTAAVVRAFSPADPADLRLESALDGLPAPVLATFDKAREQLTDRGLAEALAEVARHPALTGVMELRPELRAPTVDRLRSGDRGMLADLWARTPAAEGRAAIVLLDAAIAREERRELSTALDAFVERVTATVARSGRIFILCCGSSFHAAKTAALFFNAMAGVQVLPLLPGEFRGQYAGTVRDGDLVIAVSQSGETKDLIDVLDDITASGRSVQRVALVNNLNSTLAQEKADVVIPLRCGPEIAVAATKSFINQMAVFYGLALQVGLKSGRELGAHSAGFARIPALVEETLRSTEAAVEGAAELLYLRPSIHLLATRLLGVAKEGALKIREVVLNHTEGFEASEFKHGPNTILGFNTLFGVDQLERLLAAWPAGGQAPTVAEALSKMYADYPLIYVTGPDPRDIDLTVSQINTHKIRGVSTLVVAEEDAALRGAATKPPADNAAYRSAYVVLPHTGDPLLTAFTATVALQRLALRMSLLKMAHLDRLAVPDHGVHPDVPKNVSKSITVD